MKIKNFKNILLSSFTVGATAIIPFSVTSCAKMTNDLTLEEGKSTEFTLMKATSGSYVTTSSLDLALSEKYKFAKEEEGTLAYKLEYDNFKTEGNITLVAVADPVKFRNPTWVYDAENYAKTLSSKIVLQLATAEEGASVSFDLIITIQKYVSETSKKTYCGPSRINGIKLIY